jgi:hypothetical protein
MWQDIRDWWQHLTRGLGRRVRRLNFWVGIAILVAAAVDWLLSWKYATTYLNHNHLILVAIGVLVLYLDRFRELKVGAEGLSFKARAEKVSREADHLLRMQQSGKSVDLSQFFSATQRFQSWGTLTIYRLTLRMLLVRYSRATGMPVTDPPILPGQTPSGTERPLSIMEMLRQLSARGHLDPALCTDLDRMRNATYFAEWGGAPPSLDEVEFVLKHGRSLLERLYGRTVTAENEPRT